MPPWSHGDPAKAGAVYSLAEIHQALRHKAAETKRSVSDLVNGAVRDAARAVHVVKIGHRHVVYRS